jgi:hypothetical protein
VGYSLKDTRLSERIDMPEPHDGRLVTEEFGHGRSKYASHVASKTRAMEQREVYRRKAAPAAKARLVNKE